MVTGPGYADSFTFNSDGSFFYQPAYHYVGTDTFTYLVNDQIADSNLATVTIYVTNEAPWTTDDDYSILHDTTLDEPTPGEYEWGQVLTCNLSFFPSTRGDALTLNSRPDTNAVAVGTALAGGPPHRSVHEELPHTAPTLGH